MIEIVVVDVYELLALVFRCREEMYIDCYSGLLGVCVDARLLVKLCLFYWVFGSVGYISVLEMEGKCLLLTGRV